MSRSLIALTLLLGAAGVADAAILDVYRGNDVDGRVDASNSIAARAAFEAQLAGGAFTETFGTDGVQDGSMSPSMNYTNGMTSGAVGTLSVSASPQFGTGVFGVRTGGYNDAYAMTPEDAMREDRYFLTGVDGEMDTTVSLTFQPGVRAFGFDVSDIGDFSAWMMITFADGDTPVAVPLRDGSTTFAGSGNQLFFGFTSDSEITSIDLMVSDTNGGIGDTFGLDDFTVGLSVIPLPPAALLGLAGLGVVATRRRRWMATADRDPRRS